MKNFTKLVLSTFFYLASCQPAVAQTKVDGSQLKGNVIGGTSSNIRRIVLPKNTGANNTALTRFEANLIYNTTTGEPFWDDGTTLQAIAGTSNSQVLTNKDINGGTASNASRITLPKNTTANLSGLTRKQGTIVYDTTTNKPYYDDGSALQTLGSTLTAPRSEVFVDTGNGHGSTGTKVRRFSNIRLNSGTAITYADSAAAGATFTINEDGIYSTNYSDFKNAGVVFFASVVNASSTTTNASALTYANGRRLGTNTSAASAVQVTSWTGKLLAGDVVRAMTDGTADSADSFCAFSITQVSK